MPIVGSFSLRPSQLNFHNVEDEPPALPSTDAQGLLIVEAQRIRRITSIGEVPPDNEHPQM